MAGHDTNRCCWLCGEVISDPPEIIGQYRATQQRVAHRRCWQTLGEHELDLRQEETGPGSHPREVPGR